MSEVFISYARSTAVQAQQIAEALRALGYGVWRDDELPAHRDYSEVIEERLRAAKAVVVVWSAEAVKSQWVRAEADIAREAGTLVQLSLDGAPLPMPFNRVQCADLAGWSGDLEAPGWRKIAASVADLIGATPASNQQPPPALVLPEKPSIAVLPFADLSPGKDQDYFCDGMVEEIATALSRFSSLFVIGAGSGLSYRGTTQSLPQIARELGVRYLLEGSVRRAGERVRITVKLADAIENTPLWTERFDGSLEDVFALQDEVANAVAAQIAPAIEAAEERRAANRPTQDIGAYDLVLRGHRAGRAGGVDGIRESLELAKRAAGRDPNYALAHAAIANGEGILSSYGEDRQAAVRRTRDAAARALALAPNSPEVLASVALGLCMAGDKQPAVAMIARALELNPGAANAWTFSGFIKLIVGRYEEALADFEKAMRLDPRSSYRGFMLSGIGGALIGLGRFEEALAPLEDAAQFGPVAAHFNKGIALAHLGRMGEAKTAIAAGERTGLTIASFVEMGTVPAGYWRETLAMLEADV